MNLWGRTPFLFMGICLILISSAASGDEIVKKRMLVVSSYHRGYDWSQQTHEGFCAAMHKFGYFDHKDQITGYTNNDYLETSRTIIKKLWMDSKRKSSKFEKQKAGHNIYKFAQTFKPDIILLGDDNAARYVGKLFLDSKIPVIFWGLNNTPVKYGLLDSTEIPGHNVTGVYQSGYYTDSLNFLKSVVPAVKTFAILADNTPTGRSHTKKIEFLARKDLLPLRLVETVSTGEFEVWKRKAMELQQKVDAFFVVQFNLKGQDGNHVPYEQVAKWYVNNINIPEATQGHFVERGLLCAADDSGYNQGYEAAVIARDILENGAKPATYPARSPKRGALRVNKHRAGMLGIKLTDQMGIEEYVD